MVVVDFFLTAIVFVPIVASLSQKEYPFLKTQINDEKHAVAFNKLLKSIVKVNQKRLDAIRKLTKLQATDLYPTLEETLRSETTRRDSDESNSDSDEKNIIYLVIPDTPVPNASQGTPSVPSNEQNTSNLNIVPQKTRKPDPQQNDLITEELKLKLQPRQNKAQDYSKIGHNDINSNATQISISRDGLDALRQNIERSCRSKEAKKCKSACVAATKSACEVYECRSKLKKKLKKACKRECKDEFRSNW